MKIPVFLKKYIKRIKCDIKCDIKVLRFLLFSKQSMATQREKKSNLNSNIK